MSQALLKRLEMLCTIEPPIRATSWMAEIDSNAIS